MRKLFLFFVLSIISLNITTAGTLPTVNCSAPSNVKWTHSVYVSWVWSPWVCENHNYYNHNNYVVTWSYWTTQWTNYITSCWPDWFPVSANAWQATCMRRDDTAPNIDDDYDSDWTRNNWASKTILLTPTDSWWAWIFETKWCEWALCNPSLWTTWEIIIINANYDNTIRYQTEDYATNKSIIKSFEVKLDNTPPTVTDDYILFDWIRTIWASQTIILTPTDTWWSWIDYTKWCEWVSCDPSLWTTWSVVVINADYDNIIRYQTWDVAWNQSTIWSFHVMLDNTPPNPGDIYEITPTPDDQLATTSQNITSRISRNSWSPIVTFEIEFEKITPVDTFTSYTLSTSWSGSCWAFTCDDFSENFDIHDVDSDRITGGLNDWWREYTYKITKICDEAWNCTNMSYTKDYYIYANTLNGNITTKEVNLSQVNNLSLTTNKANWTSYPFDITLKDTYWNEVIPAWWINRKINFVFDIDNTMYLNQYSKTWESSIRIKAPSSWLSYLEFPIWSGEAPFNNQPSTDWTYPFEFKVYTPTYNTYSLWDPVSDPDAMFYIRNLEIDIEGDIWLRTSVPISNSNNIDFRFSPLYTTTISWKLINEWFLEWTTQSAKIKINDLSWGTVVTNKKVYFEFSSWATNEEHPKLDLSLSWSQSPGFTYLIEWNQISIATLLYRLPSFITGIDYDIETLLTQAAWSTLDDISNSHFSTHIYYELGWYQIAYNSDIFWKDSYWDPNSWTWVTQWWLKVLWIATSTAPKTHEILQGQDKDSLHIIWEFEKANVKQFIRRQAHVFIKNVSQNNGWYTVNDLSWETWLNTDGKKIYEEKILYFWPWNRFVELNGDLVEWNKTIVIEWLDLYINSDMYYWDKEKDTLWIIVLRDQYWNGGNVYINPEVTNIVWAIYADKALISAIDNNWNYIIEDSEEMWWELPQSALKNQLHIYGSVFSENTMWWSRANPITCPYYKTTGGCISTDDYEKMKEAQKYDLNYLRRYTLNKSNRPLNNWKVAWWWTCDISWSCTSDSKYARYIMDTSDEYAKFPIIIESDPSILSSPPPLFTEWG